jgi:hypothetical protein
VVSLDKFSKIIVASGFGIPFLDFTVVKGDYLFVGIINKSDVARITEIRIEQRDWDC